MVPIITYKKNSTGFDVKAEGRKLGTISRRGGIFKARLARYVSVAEMQNVACFVQQLNAETA